MATKTEKSIERDFYEFVSKSELAKSVSGEVYRNGMRPPESEQEDIVVKFLSGLDEQIQSGIVVLNIYVPDEVIIERSAGRRYCPKCGATFHVKYNPPKEEGGKSVCTVCGSEVAVREDDKPEVVKQRLKVYHEQTQPLEAFYAERGKLRTVIGQEEVKDTTRLTLDAIKGD